MKSTVLEYCGFPAENGKFTEKDKKKRNKVFCKLYPKKINYQGNTTNMMVHLWYHRHSEYLKVKAKGQVKQVDILISKNQALQILYLKHIKLYKLATMDRNPRKFNPHKLYCTVLLLYYNSKQNIPYNWPTEQILTRILGRLLISYALFN